MKQAGWHWFLDLCSNTKDETLLNGLFDLFLTHEERESLETRCLIIQALLQKKHPQRQISEQLNVSIAKITRGSNELKRQSSTLRHYLEDHLPD